MPEGDPNEEAAPRHRRSRRAHLRNRARRRQLRRQGGREEALRGGEDELPQEVQRRRRRRRREQLRREGPGQERQAARGRGSRLLHQEVREGRGGEVTSRRSPTRRASGGTGGGVYAAFPFPMISAVSIAICSSSLVGMTAAIGLVVDVIRPLVSAPLARFAAGSICIPRKPSASTIFARTGALFSPIPPVKTRASRRPSATLIDMVAFATESQNLSMAS